MHFVHIFNTIKENIIVFKARKDNNGELDPNVNTRGRIAKTEKPTNRSLREKYTVELLRKLRPLQSVSITAAMKIIQNEKSSDQNTLKAAALLTGLYRSVLNDAYGKDDSADDEAEMIQEENVPSFSLRMIKNEDTE